MTPGGILSVVQRELQLQDGWFAKVGLQCLLDTVFLRPRNE